MKFTSYIPKQGDVIWINLNPQSGHEQTGKRPALVLSPVEYNKKVGLALLCPITTQIKRYPFEVLISAGSPVSGVVLSDQIKSLDWHARNCQFICSLPKETTSEVLKKLYTILSG